MVELKEVEGPPDEALIQECQSGNRSAFDLIVRRYKDRIYNLLYRMAGNHEDALDLSQEVFVRAYRSLNSFHGQSQLFTWLYSIAANVARNHWRDRGRKGRNKGRSLDALVERAPAALEQAPNDTETPRQAAEANELQEALDHCLEHLGEHYRLVFSMRVFDNLDYQAIAGIAECPPGTVKSRLNQARKLLRDCLKRQGVL